MRMASFILHIGYVPGEKLLCPLYLENKAQYSRL